MSAVLTGAGWWREADHGAEVVKLDPPTGGLLRSLRGASSSGTQPGQAGLVPRPEAPA